MCSPEPEQGANTVSFYFPEFFYHFKSSLNSSNQEQEVCTLWKRKLWDISLNMNVLYILESNPHTVYSFRGLKNQMRIRIACGLDSRSWAGFWKNDRAAVRAVRTIQYNNLLFYLLFIIYNIYNLLFIRLAVITHNWIVIRHPVTIIFIFTIVLPQNVIIGSAAVRLYRWQLNGHLTHGALVG